MMEAALDQYRECWRRIIFDATGDSAKALRALELADINGMFDPIKHAYALRTLVDRDCMKPSIRNDAVAP